MPGIRARAIAADWAAANAAAREQERERIDAERRQFDADFMQPGEVARLLGVTTGTLRAWRSRGRGPAFVRLGDQRQSRVRYPVAAVAAWRGTLPHPAN
jgi:hypothetical protein